jgi:hypothetical protein
MNLNINRTQVLPKPATSETDLMIVLKSSLPVEAASRMKMFFPDEIPTLFDNVCQNIVKLYRDNPFLTPDIERRFFEFGKELLEPAKLPMAMFVGDVRSIGYKELYLSDVALESHLTRVAQGVLLAVTVASSQEVIGLVTIGVAELKKYFRYVDHKIFTSEIALYNQQLPKIINFYREQMGVYLSKGIDSQGVLKNTHTVVKNQIVDAVNTAFGYARFAQRLKETLDGEMEIYTDLVDPFALFESWKDDFSQKKQYLTERCYPLSYLCSHTQK